MFHSSTKPTRLMSMIHIVLGYFCSHLKISAYVEISSYRNIFSYTDFFTYWGSVHLYWDISIHTYYWNLSYFFFTNWDILSLSVCARLFLLILRNLFYFGNSVHTELLQFVLACYVITKCWLIFSSNIGIILACIGIVLLILRFLLGYFISILWYFCSNWDIFVINFDLMFKYFCK